MAIVVTTLKMASWCLKGPIKMPVSFKCSQNKKPIANATTPATHIPKTLMSMLDNSNNATAGAMAIMHANNSFFSKSHLM